MRSLVVALSLVIGAVLNGGASAQMLALATPAAGESACCHYDLVFQPREGHELIVLVTDEKDWTEGKEDPVRYHQRTKAEIAWSFERRDAKSWHARGRLLSAIRESSRVHGKEKVEELLSWTRADGEAKRQDGQPAPGWFADEVEQILTCVVDRSGVATSQDADGRLFSRAGLYGSSLLGFGASLSGKSTAPSEKWTKKGDLLGTDAALTARYRIEKVASDRREQIAHISGSVVSGWPQTAPGAKAPRTSFTASFALGTRTPRKSRLSFEHGDVAQVIETSARWQKVKARTQLASLRR
ncbi:MAG: hypothetical protein R3F20_16565 [Planctomycetota bacterium]